jgi:hydrogenase expression/formation protein HypE
MAHGAGGKDSGDLMREVFGRHFANPVLERMEDASPIDLRSDFACVSTDSFVVTPVEFPGGDIGKLAVCGSVNDVLMMGATPKYLTCGYILEEGLSIETLDRVVESMAKEARDSGIIIVAGDTKVIERRGAMPGSTDGVVASESSGLMINTTCIGEFETSQARGISAANAKPRDAVIVSGTLGDHHACILSARMGIKNGIQSDCAALAPITRTLIDCGVDVHVMRDITRGGLATGLNEIAATSGGGIEIEESAVPVDSEVRAFCGIMGLDPLYMGNEGKLAVFVGEADEARALEIMRNKELGRNARIIGRVADTAAYAGGDTGAIPVTGFGASAVRMRTRLGGTRRIDMLIGEGLPRIC